MLVNAFGVFTDVFNGLFNLITYFNSKIPFLGIIFAVFLFYTIVRLLLMPFIGAGMSDVANRNWQSAVAYSQRHNIFDRVYKGRNLTRGDE